VTMVVQDRDILSRVMRANTLVLGPVVSTAMCNRGSCWTERVWDGRRVTSDAMTD
jgi:hypothetical protein